MSYQIEFLDHDAFDALPYPDMDRSLGVADPRTQKAFVRKTGIKAVDLFNAAHELEHLQDGHAGTHADHYRNGVYYKDGGQWMQTAAPFANFIPGIGPLLSVGLGAGGGMMHQNAQAKQAQSAMGQSGQSQNVMDQFQSASQGSTPAPPNVVQATGGGGGSSGLGGPSSSGGLSSIQDQMYGNYAGRG